MKRGVGAFTSWMMNGGTKMWDGYNETIQPGYRKSAMHKAYKEDMVKGGHKPLNLPAFRNMIGDDFNFVRFLPNRYVKDKHPVIVAIDSPARQLEAPAAADDDAGSANKRQRVEE